jgi:hypothetical protein
VGLYSTSQLEEKKQMGNMSGISEEEEEEVERRGLNGMMSDGIYRQRTRKDEMEEKG